MSLEVDHIDYYERNAHEDIDLRPNHEPYDFGHTPPLHRFIPEPSTNISTNWYSLSNGEGPMMLYPSGPNKIARITFIGSGDSWISTDSNANQGTSFQLPATPLQICTSQPIYLWGGSSTDVGVIIEEWTMNDDRL